jgi:glycosyltransferase involved in cell wall biosynthesis
MNYFSIILCCFNAEKYIIEALDSIKNLNYHNYELIIINDGSTDKTDEIINLYKSKFKNIIYFKQENLGLAGARNKAIRLANYQWIVMLDHDDIMDKNRLTIHNDQINSDKESKLFFADCAHFVDKLTIKKRHFEMFNLHKYNLNKYNAGLSLLIKGSFVPSSSVLFSKDAALSVGLLDNKYSYIGDYHFFIKMGLKYKFSYSKEIISYWRIHPNQSTVSMSTIANKEFIILLINYLFKIDFNLFFYMLILKKIFIQIIKLITKK